MPALRSRRTSAATAAGLGRVSAKGPAPPSSSLDQDYLNLKERERINQLSLTMLRHRTLNSNPSATTNSSFGSQANLARAGSTNPFSHLPPISNLNTASFVPNLNPTDFIPGLSGQNIYNPNLTADEIR